MASDLGTLDSVKLVNTAILCMHQKTLRTEMSPSGPGEGRGGQVGLRVDLGEEGGGAVSAGKSVVAMGPRCSKNDKHSVPVGGGGGGGGGQRGALWYLLYPFAPAADAARDLELDAGCMHAACILPLGLCSMLG
ncbi:hypothetical protein CH63R_07444 [Colletotrichum higginsianum IMI 349063]|uniref:Uncharacterized protein n=1 Tax=Colletotrichum higginsianum (strain IMI 349063) TaxID=759273 RepID=A0A1B7Y9E0_COLHI|nr:hypothetical protein CH63R_07444 [Colletotrichum higginsianum IMI 349063]OBR08679.1 hypothetical protein CH63R_07444 [Colletotrichum higginsianum IMI 349063]